MKKFTKAVVACVLVTAVCVTASGCTNTKKLMEKTETQTFNTDGENFKVGVISDTQLPPTEKQLAENGKYLENFKKALTVLKNNDVDMILFAGDIGDLGTRFAFQTYSDAIDEVFGDDKPIIQTIMGNHDYWNKSFLTAIDHEKAFSEILGQSPFTHYVVNGYHFIGASPDSGNMTKGYKNTAEWLDKEIAEAEKTSDGKPIFVMTHNQPVNTSYGSEDWGDTTLDEVLSKYPNVIDMSGHVHYSLLDERSVWQGNYTVINTQSLSYTELEKGKENGTIPPNADETPMGYIIEFNEDNFAFHRMNFADGELGKEEKTDMLWTFPLPYSNDKRYDFSSRAMSDSAPYFDGTDISYEFLDDKLVLNFDAAVDDDFVHSYKIYIDDKDPVLYFSDFYNGIDDMNSDVTLTVDDVSHDDEHNVRITAVDSWGLESESSIAATIN